MVNIIYLVYALIIGGIAWFLSKKKGYNAVSHFSFAVVMVFLIYMNMKSSNGFDDYFVRVALGIAALVSVGRGIYYLKTKTK